MTNTKGAVTGVNGNMVSVRVDGTVSMNEVAYIIVGGKHLKSEIIKIQGDIVQTQVFEMTKGIKVGDPVELTGEMLAVELGPGLLGKIYDGLQNPLPEVAKQSGYFLESGVYLDALPRDVKWDWMPVAKAGDRVERADVLGAVPEGAFTHQVMVPFGMRGSYTVKSVKPAGQYTVAEEVAVLQDESGAAVPVTMMFRWPVKRAVDCYAERLKPVEPMVTKTRIIDTFFPVAKGGTYCIPGPFGAGKTVLQ